MTPSHLDLILDEARKYGVPNRLYMNAVEYADVRKFGRDVLDIETKVENLKKGFMGQYKGVQIMTTRTLPPGVIEAVGGDEACLVHVSRSFTGDQDSDFAHRGPGLIHPGAYASCESDDACTVRYVMEA